jgi:RND family efflux transporter MFP subunit
MKRVGCIILLSVFFTYSCSKKRERIKPVLSDITESVYASAKVKAVDQYEVFSTVNGILKEIAINPGDTVKAGEILFVLDNNTARLNTESARLSLELSGETSDRIGEMELNVRQSRDRYLLDSSLYLRQKRLWEQNIGTQLEFEQRRLAFSSSANNYASARAKLRQLQIQLGNEQERAKIGYRVSRSLESDYIISSTISGVVYDVLKDKGELITPQTPLAVIGRSSYILEMNVDENDIAKVRVGQSVEITMDSYKGQVFEGVVNRIYPIMDERSRTFQVDAHFVTLPSSLYPKLTAEANIIIQTKKNALIIPRNYLQDNQYVWISKDKKRKVKTGLRDYQKVQILHGIDTSQFIYEPK